MKLINCSVFVIVLALLVGCTTTFRPWRLSEIEEGMGRAQVVRILGEPDFAEVKDGSEFLYYSYSENYNPPPTNDDIRAHDASREFQKKQLLRSFNEYNYSVELVDGKVLGYKELVE